MATRKTEQMAAMAAASEAARAAAFGALPAQLNALPAEQREVLLQIVETGSVPAGTAQTTLRALTRTGWLQRSKVEWGDTPPYTHDPRRHLSAFNLELVKSGRTLRSLLDSQR